MPLFFKNFLSVKTICYTIMTVSVLAGAGSAQADQKTLTIMDDGSGTPKAVWSGHTSESTGISTSPFSNEVNPPPIRKAAPDPSLCPSPNGLVPLVVNPGDLLSVVIANWARERGYDLTWQAPQYKSNGQMRVEKDFDQTLTELKGMLDLNDIHLNMTIYKNCTVRVTEVQS